MMKTIKKAFTMLLAVVMVLSLGVTAFAASDGSITITNATVGQTYEVYKLFDATYSGTNVSYTITATGSNTALITALKSDDSVFTLTASATNNSVYVVTVKEGQKESDVIAYVKSIAHLLGSPVATKKAAAAEEETTTVKFENLDYGYYYITSTLGTVVTIDSALKDVEITDKNVKPDTDKKVKEDSNGTLGQKNTADIGDKVEFTTTITAQPGAENYVLHDTMTAGLTFDSTSVKVTVGEKTLTAGTDYTLVTSPIDGCTFEITFTKSYLDSITASTTITVTYSATVNSNAVIDGGGNTNKTHLSYGENSDVSTTEKTTTTYVFDVDILKYTAGENDTRTPLSGAEFVLYKTVVENEENVNYYAKVENGKLTGWTTNKSEATTLTSGEDGKISVDGLDADTYYLEETKAPAGYNLLADPVTVVIDEDGKVKVDNTEVTTVEIENKTGTELPSTGGIGTTIFYVVGSILVIGAVVLLITKKRMSGSAE